MSVGTASSTLDIVNKIVQGFDVDMIDNKKDSKSSGSEIQESIKNMTNNSCSYSSTLDASRSHLRLKMSSNGSKPGLSLPSGRSSMKIPSLLQKLPCHGPSGETPPVSSNGASAASAVTLSALSVIERGTGAHEAEEIRKDSEFVEKLSQQLSAATPDKKIIDTLVNLDNIDLDNITIGDLHGLQAADGDTLRAKHLNKLTRKEREHVLQDIHGVADVVEETTDDIFIEDSLKKLQVEIDHELVRRKASDDVGAKKGENNEYEEKKQEEPTPTSQGGTAKLPALEEQLGKLQEKLDQLVRRRNNLDSSINVGKKQLSAKNHPMFGKLGDGGFGSFPFNKNKSDIRPNLVQSSCFGGPSSFFGSSMAKSSISATFMTETSEAQQDDAILKSENTIAYEQALAQCRGRRRDRNNSLFRPNLMDGSGDEDDDLDEGLFIDVEQREFRLSFLRAERYDVKKAAMRLLDYFEEKRGLFGVHSLTTKVQIKDLDAETKGCLESGEITLLPGRDRAGRAVIVATKKLASNLERRKDERCILRAFWVLCSIALEDVQTETNGVVFVKYSIGRADRGSIREYSNDGFHRRIRDWGNILRALPLRVASIHWCVENHTLKQAANLSALMLGGSNFVRVRCHAGSDMEVQYDLMTFGIPTDLFPISMTGKIELARHLSFLQERKKMEASTLLNKALALVEAPMLEDCIALDANEDRDAEIAMVTPSSMVNRGDRFSTNPLAPVESSHHIERSNFQRQNQTQYQQEQQYQKQLDEYNNMSKFSDSFYCAGSRNSMQVQSPMFEQRRQQQQRLNTFQHLNMGMVQQFSQRQQIQRQHSQNTGITAESKSGIAYSMEPVLVPGELDILLGRGRGAQNHKGNIHYRQVVETFRSRYEQIPQKGAKTQLIREVVAVIYDNGGRFLKQDGFGRWIPVDPEVARDKVSHSFRNQKRLSVGAGISDSSSTKKRSRDEAE